MPLVWSAPVSGRSSLPITELAITELAITELEPWRGALT